MKNLCKCHFLSQFYLVNYFNNCHFILFPQLVIYLYFITVCTSFVLRVFCFVPRDISVLSSRDFRASFSFLFAFSFFLSIIEHRRETYMQRYFQSCIFKSVETHVTSEETHIYRTQYIGQTCLVSYIYLFVSLSYVT